jgi:prolyl oligopeptidase
MNGYVVRDPYEKLEYKDSYTENPLAKEWVERQNKATESFLAHAPVSRASIDTRLGQLSEVGYVNRPAVAGDRTFFTRRVGDAEQPVLVMLEGGKEKVLLDVAALDASGKVALDWFYPSLSGRKIAYGLSHDGSEQSVLHVLDVDAGKDLADAIPDTRAATVAWLKDESGFFYSRYPPGTNADRRIYFHHLGDEPGADRKVFGDGLDPSDWVDVSISHDDQHVFLSTSKGWSKSELDLLDRKTGKIVKLAGAELGALFSVGEMVGGKVYALTNYQAPRFRLVAIDPANPKPAAWKTVIPQGEWPLESALFTGGRILVTRTVKAVSHLEQYAMDGKLDGDVKLPGLGAIEGFSGDFDGDRVVFGYATFLTPPALHELKVGKTAGEAKVLVQVPKSPDTSAFTVDQVDVPSYDGTLVPMFVLHRKDAKRDGTNPVLLTGYGGFNVSYTPAYSTNALFWLERGGVFALANLRGGAEFGETWHEAGRLGNKHQVFRDFEYAMRWLIQNDWTRPARLAITGGSNGGLLMGAMMTQAPELFRVCVGRVGLYDMLKFQDWKLGHLWVDEYGSAKKPDQLGYLLGYSPYHQVIDGVAYPAFLGLTGDNDSRVTGVHTLKFVARLQDAQAGKAPILFHMESKAGHGQGKNRSDAVAEQAMMFQFILSQLPAQSGGGGAAAAP